MIFLSKAAGYILCVRDPLVHFPGQGMPPEQLRPALVADFGAAGGQTLMSDEWDDDDGNTHADVRGGVFDSVEAAERLGWTDEERGLVEQKMLRLCGNQRFTDFRLYEKPVPTAPWPTYDRTDAKKVAAFAADLGLVREALHYEEATQAREQVILALRAAVEQSEVEDALTAA